MCLLMNFANKNNDDPLRRPLAHPQEALVGAGQEPPALACVTPTDAGSSFASSLAGAWVNPRATPAVSSPLSFAQLRQQQLAGGAAPNYAVPSASSALSPSVPRPAAKVDMATLGLPAVAGPSPLSPFVHLPATFSSPPAHPDPAGGELEIGPPRDGAKVDMATLGGAPSAEDLLLLTSIPLVFVGYEEDGGEGGGLSSQESQVD